MSEDDGLSTWTIFRRPADFPNTPFVVRRFNVTRGGVIIPAECFKADTLDQARAGLPPDAVCLGRQKKDPLVVVETWV